MQIYSNDKELITAGALPYQVGGPAFWYRWLAPGKYDTSHIDTEVLQAALAQWKNDPRIFILDIEEFDLYGPNRPYAVQQMRLAGEAWISTPRKVGWYGIIPEQRKHYWTCASSVLTPDPPHMASFRAWQKVNEANYYNLRANRMNFYCPSVYAFYKPGQGGYGSWNAYATALVGEALRLSRGKPVFPFIWPIYHPSCGGGAIALDEWESMVRHITAIRNLSGVVVWLQHGDAPCEGWKTILLDIVGGARG